MSITVVPTGILKQYVNGQEAITLEPGKSIFEMLETLGIPSAMVALALVNGRQRFKDVVPEEGTTVTLLPLIGGG